MYSKIGQNGNLPNFTSRISSVMSIGETIFIEINKSIGFKMGKKGASYTQYCRQRLEFMSTEP